MILSQLQSKLVSYSKASDTLRLGVLRYYLAAVKNKEIELRPQKQELTDEIIYRVLLKQIKQRKESIDLYDKGGRKDLVEKETSELAVLEEISAMFPQDLIDSVSKMQNMGRPKQ